MNSLPNDVKDIIVTYVCGEYKNKDVDDISSIISDIRIKKIEKKHDDNTYQVSAYVYILSFFSMIMMAIIYELTKSPTMANFSKDLDSLGAQDDTKNKVRNPSSNYITSAILSVMFSNEYLAKSMLNGGYIINWIALCLNSNVPEAFYESHLDKLDWSAISDNRGLPQAFYERHLDKLDWYVICRNKLPVEFFKKHLDRVYWSSLCMNTSLPESFYEENLHMLDEECWYKLSTNPAVSEAFIEKYSNKISWMLVFSNSAVSEAFVKKHFDKIDWNYVCLNCNMPESFYAKNIDKINWINLFHNRNVSYNFIASNIPEEHKHILDNCVTPDNIKTMIYKYQSNMGEVPIHHSVISLISVYLLRSIIYQL